MSTHGIFSGRPPGESSIYTEKESGILVAAEEVPEPTQMIQMLGAFEISQALYAVAKLGLSTALANGPRPTGDLAGTTGAKVDVPGSAAA